MKPYVFVPCILFFVACAEDEQSEPIWTDESQRIVITVDNGNVPADASRYQVYDRSLDTLSDTATSMLENMTTTGDDLFCQNDGRTYELSITDESGLETLYGSDNADCGRMEYDGFVEAEWVEDLISEL